MQPLIGAHLANEREFIHWLSQQKPGGHGAVTVGIGDDMAVLRVGDQTILTSTDMLLDSVHFDSSEHSPQIIGYKAVACCLSDCAAMAVKPIAVCMSVAAPRSASDEYLKALCGAAIKACDAFECELVGGDTTAWDRPLAVDISVTATTYPGIEPIMRNGARAGDQLFVTGKLGGSRTGKHVSFVPRIHEAYLIAATLTHRLHAMIDISDGLAIDADRIAEASGVGLVLSESMLENVASDAARRLSRDNGRSVIDRVLGDGEDFELLVVANVDSQTADQLHLSPVGRVDAGRGLHLQSDDGSNRPITPCGFQHFS